MLKIVKVAVGAFAASAVAGGARFFAPAIAALGIVALSAMAAIKTVIELADLLTR